MNSKTRRWLERGKTLLILLLAVCAVYLIARVSLAGTPDGQLDALFSSLRGPEPPRESDAAQPNALVHPVRLAVSGGKPGRFGAQYDRETVDSRFSGALHNLFSDALSAAVSPRRATLYAVEQALAAADRPVVYLGLAGNVPAHQLPVWLGGRTPNHALTGQVRRLFLTTDRGGSVLLYYRNEGDGSYYACDVPGDLSPRLEDAVAKFESNGAKFAFEDPEQYAGLAPHTLLLPEVPRPAVYAATNPVAMGTEELSALVRALGFHPQSGSLVLGDYIVRQGADTLRVSPTGMVSFYAAAAESPRYPVDDGKDSDPAQLADAARRLLEDCAAQRIGGARLFYSGAKAEEDGTALYFHYELDGAPVQVGTTGYAARVLCREGRVAAFTLQLRHYEDTGNTSIVLPELQAAAAMAALDAGGGTLELCYVDTLGDKAQAGWVT